VEPRVSFGATEPLQQASAFDFDFDFDNGVWASTDPYSQLGNGYPKDQLDWLVQGFNFPEPFA
jgi:hypothetical protein